MSLSISVIMAVYNGSKYLAEAIDSVLGQTLPPHELVLVDDGSTDDTASIARQYGLTYLHQQHQGQAAGWNNGLRQASGGCIAFLDADDYWPLNKLARQAEVFDDQPELDMCFGHMQQFHSPELDDETRLRIVCPPDPMPGYSAGTMAIKRSALERVGEFNPQPRVRVFVDWYLKAQEAGLKHIMLPDTLLFRRLHSANVSLTRRSERTDILHILKESLDRRRGDQQE